VVVQNRVQWHIVRFRLKVLNKSPTKAQTDRHGLGFLEGEHRLFAQLLYGTGMRISEGLQLRVKDLDFDHGTIIVREGKGSKDC
jgi:integrase